MERAQSRGTPDLAQACLSARDLAVTAGILAVSVGLYAATRQERIYGHDGAFLVDAFALGIEGTSNCALYAGAAAWLGRVVPRAADPILPLWWLSHLCGALAVAGAFLIARAAGATLRGAVFGAALLAAAPAQWFFATTIETHALHAAAVCAAALACLLGPWDRPVLARALAALSVPLLFLTHQAGLLLLPGWLLLARVARARRAPALPASDFLWTGLALAPAVLLSVALANLLFGAGFTLWAPETAPTRFLAQFTRRFTLAGAWQGFALPLFALLPVAAWTLAAGRVPGPSRRALVVLTGVPALVFLWLSIPERGGYFLGCAPFLAALCAFAPLPAGARGWALACALVGLQVVAGLGEVAAYGNQFPIDGAGGRASALRAGLGEGGVLLRLNPNVPHSQVWVAEVHDYDLHRALLPFVERGAAPEEFAAFIEGEVRRVFPAVPVALDLSYRRLYEEPPSHVVVVSLEPYLVALEERLMDGFKTRLVEHPWWPLLVLEP